MNNPAYMSGAGNPWSEMILYQPRRLTERGVIKIQPKVIQATRGINRSNNHTHIIWSENGQLKTVSIGNMSRVGTFHDRGGLTKAGRALEKKGGRGGSVFPKATGNVREINMQGQRMLDEILNHPDKHILFEKPPTLEFETLDVVLPDGRGARFTKDGKTMVGFLEPKK